EMSEVERVSCETIEVVTADAAQDLRETLIDLRRMLVCQAADDAITLPLAIRLSRYHIHLSGRQRSSMDDTTVGEDDAQLQNVIDRLAVNEGVRTRRVVGDHAAEGRPAGRRDVWGELQAVPLQLQVEIVQHTAGTDAHPALGRV